MAAQIREDDVVTAFGVTDAPLDTAVATNGRSPYNATASGVTDEQQRQHTFVKRMKEDESRRERRRQKKSRP